MAPHPSPLVSVIVPAFNYARFLPHALDSLLAQTHAHWECIVVDDGSTDDTAAVVGAYVERDPRFQYIRQQSRGPAAARNRGIERARGEYVQFLDADDRLLPDKLALHAGYLDAHPETDIVYGELAYFRSEAPEKLLVSLQGKMSRSLMPRVHGVDEARRKLEHYNILPLPAAVVRRSVFARAGVFDENARGSEDYGFWIQCAAAGCRFDHCEHPAPAAAVRTHGASTSRDFRRMQLGLIAVAKAFAASPLARAWPGGELPLIYQVAEGIDLIDRGSRRAGVRRIWRAAQKATEPLTGWRWRVYAFVAAIAPRSLFLRFTARPIPERPFEIYRRVRSLFGREK